MVWEGGFELRALVAPNNIGTSGFELPFSRTSHSTDWFFKLKGVLEVFLHWFGFWRNSLHCGNGIVCTVYAHHSAELQSSFFAAVSTRGITRVNVLAFVLSKIKI